MKTLTLLPPWAALVVTPHPTCDSKILKPKQPNLFQNPEQVVEIPVKNRGIKEWETRSWKTNYRGRLLIHTSGRFQKQDKALLEEWPFSIYRNLLEKPALGCIIGSVDVLDCISTLEWKHKHYNLHDDFCKQELFFGDYNDGRYAWHLANPIMFDVPVKVAGNRMLWDYPDELVAAKGLG